MARMRAKMKIASVEPFGEDGEQLTFGAVCKIDPFGEDGVDENNSFARWTPSASLEMTVNNPALKGAFAVGDEYYLDFTKAD